MDKKNEFIKLAHDVGNCHLCKYMVTYPNSTSGEYLHNDAHGLNADKPYVNLWNLWQGNLDADIMVVGQDFGQIEDIDDLLQAWKTGTYTNPTEVRLRQLFKTSFQIDIDAEEASLFFTNMANCYRKNRTSGSVHSAWLPICANKFMERLIRIIQPKIIIALGRTTFEALYCMEGLTVKCINPIESGKHSFSEMIQHHYQIDLRDATIGVFPVFHPGSNSQMNRSFDEQVADWKRIAEYYNKVK